MGTYEVETVAYELEDLPADFELATMRAARDSINVAMLIDTTTQRLPFINERMPMSVTHGIMTFKRTATRVAAPQKTLMLL